MTKPSRVFWAIGLLGLIWNALGCFNFILQMDPFDAHSGEKCDVSRHPCTHLRVCIIHKCAAVFDYKDGVTKPLNVWERF